MELHFLLEETQGLTEEERLRAMKKLSSRLTNSGELILQCDESRSQHKNKEIVTQRFLDLLKQAIVKPKARKKTKTPKAAKLKRLREKKKLSEKKAARKNPLKE